MTANQSCAAGDGEPNKAGWHCSRRLSYRLPCCWGPVYARPRCARHSLHSQRRISCPAAIADRLQQSSMPVAVCWPALAARPLSRCYARHVAEIPRPPFGSELRKPALPILRIRAHRPGKAAADNEAAEPSHHQMLAFVANGMSSSRSSATLVCACPRDPSGSRRASPPGAPSSIVMTLLGPCSTTSVEYRSLPD